MKALFEIFALALITIFSIGEMSHADVAGPTAYAVPLTGITIDGNLDDWPKDMIIYPILNNGRFYGPTDIDDANLTMSPDLSPGFMVGYELENNLIYLAVRVRDDSIRVAVQDPWHTDACEVYVDGGNRGKTMSVNPAAKAEDLPALQYLLCPPGGGYGASLLNADPSANPNLFAGDIAKTKTKGANSRIGDISVYEWAIQAFDHYPDSPTRLEAGKAIGFDVVAVDKDSDTDNAAWICWGPIAGMKCFNADKLGKLVFLTSYADFGELAGTITRAREKTAYPGCIIEICRGDQVAGSVTTDAQGKFTLRLVPGQYSVRPRRGQGIEPPKETLYTVTAGKQTTADVALSPVKLPVVLQKSMSKYASIKSYRDTTIIETHMVSPGADYRFSVPLFFTFERPNRLRLENTSGGGFGGLPRFSLVSDGDSITTYLVGMNQYTRVKAPSVITSSSLQGVTGGLIESMIDQAILLSGDPLQKFLADAEGMKVIGIEKLGAVPVTVLEFMKPVSSLPASQMVPPGKANTPISVRLWIGTSDLLIWKATYELDMSRFAEDMPKEQRAALGAMKMEMTETHKKIEINPVLSDTTFSFVPPEGVQLVGQFGPPQMKTDEKSQLTGKPAPDFILKEIDGKETKLADFKGKVLIVDFWATWCGPCRTEIPTFIVLQSQYASKGFSMIGISVDEQSEKAKTFAADNKMNYPILMADEKVKRDYGGISTIPTTFVIDKKGIIRDSHVGVPSDMMVFQRKLEELLAE